MHHEFSLIDRKKKIWFFEKMNNKHTLFNKTKVNIAIKGAAREKINK